MKNILVFMETPILLVSTRKTKLKILQKIFKDLGFTFSVSNDDKIVPDIKVKPLTIISCSSKTRIQEWFSYIERGGILILVNPDKSVAKSIGMKEYAGYCDEAILSFKLYNDKKPIEVQVKAKLSKFKKASGKIKGILKFKKNNYDEFPGVVEKTFGKGKILTLLFSIEELLTFFQQRNCVSQTERMSNSAEKIALFGIDKSYIKLPQLDMFFGFLSGYIVRELLKIGRPIPRFGYLPGGYRNLITFGFDDFCISGKPIKREIETFKKEITHKRNIFDFFKNLYQLMIKLISLFLQYPKNYKIDVIRLIDLFKIYGANASAYLLPFWGPIKNKANHTGYSGFSRKTFSLLKKNGWDVGTHIKPQYLKDYNVIHKKYVSRFGVPPTGHRGHQLGWVNNDMDWKRLSELGYTYDSTWTWGGFSGLTWILGTSFPFQPINKDGDTFKILEMPVVAWIKDLYKTPSESIKMIERMLDLYPGIYNFGAHSWKTNKKAYLDFIVKILEIGKQRDDTGLEFNLLQIAEYWNKRGLSDFKDFNWENEKRIFSFKTVNQFHKNLLSIYLPFCWRELKVNKISVNGKEDSFKAYEIYGLKYAVFQVRDLYNKIEVKYG